MTVDLVQYGELRKIRGMSGPKTMLLQCCADYPGIPDVRTMTLSQIAVFYEGLVDNLIASTKPTQ